MKKNRLIITVSVILTIFSILLATSALADRGRGRGGDEWRSKRDSHSERDYGSRYREDRRSHERYRNDRNFIFDTRFNHNRYYPKRGYVVRELPHNHRVFKYRRDNYYFDDGIWYRPSGVGFSVVLPPVGLTLPLLPPFYTTVWVRGTPYYYADEVYYRWRAEDRVYEVVDPPSEKEAVTEPPIPDKLFIYPKSGQSEEQQATDRYECHRWSTDETGFDPTRPGGDVPEEQHEEKRLQYQRAMKACLEAREYSVQ
ncbi:MAG: hypothetical protein KKG47_06840 [Proteobacteria bacterium]|nr:hypothetical protein [Pseudomonadota bacterium]MBU1739121.1 hypothetical protein [Pseudomonadota bacterium]